MDRAREIGRCSTLEDLVRLAPQMGVELTEVRFVRISQNNLQILTSDRKEDRLALRELKRRTKELRLIKRTIKEFMRQARSNYTSIVRHRGPAVRGGGWLGRLFRITRAASNANHRASLATELSPFENGLRIVDAGIRSLESLQIRLEAEMDGT